MFSITQGKGFYMKFKNGLTISVQFGDINYCENRRGLKKDADTYLQYDCCDAEVAIWDDKGDWKTKDFIKNIKDDVKGYLTTEEVADLINNVSKFV